MEGSQVALISVDRHTITRHSMGMTDTQTKKRKQPMIRRHVFITERMDQAFAVLSKRFGVSASEMMRRAMDEYIDKVAK